LLKARGRQRTDSTHVLASVRVLGRLELVGETLRAALRDKQALRQNGLRESLKIAFFIMLTNVSH
jgi:hypothetical protein